MGLFKDMLGAGDSLFINEVALDYEFLPKLLPYRESEQKYLATCIAPLINNRTGKNLFIYGAPGIGKTAALKFVLRDLEEETDDVVPVYINCWQKNTTYKIMIDLCEILGYKLTHNKRTDELFRVVKHIVNKKSVVFVFDEVDKLEDYERTTIDAVLNLYGGKPAQWLSDLTHMENPWKEARKGRKPGENCQKEITHAAMVEYYSSL